MEDDLLPVTIEELGSFLCALPSEDIAGKMLLF
jgi:hypothetical protein